VDNFYWKMTMGYIISLSPTFHFGNAIIKQNLLYGEAKGEN